VHQGGPEITLPGLAVAGRQLNTPQLRGNVDWRIADTLTRAAGRHTLKAGFDLDLVWRDGTLAQDFGGRYVFTALPTIPGLVPRPLTALEAFEQGLPALYFQGYGATTASGMSRLFSAFVQDRWRLSARVTLDAGLRYQRYALGVPPVTVSDLSGTRFTYDVPGGGDLAPRLSVTVDPDGRGRTSLRAAFGVFTRTAAGRARDRDRRRTTAAPAPRGPAALRRGLAITGPPAPSADVGVPEHGPGGRSRLPRALLAPALGRLDAGAGKGPDVQRGWDRRAR
jgi:hypothetical protein